LLRVDLRAFDHHLVLACRNLAQLSRDLCLHAFEEG
jgi:hypothetical protein